MPVCGQDVWKVGVPKSDQPTNIKLCGQIDSVNVWKEIEGEIGTKVLCWQVHILRVKYSHVPTWSWVVLLRGRWFILEEE